ncbi:metal-dependent transcriptional regulator [Halobacteriales archaeon SW_8_65_20]|nr:MAG: metal-dependent transcriptional regulator [Halobacteriales archaeon QH_7_65_31]PSQ29643.1 MAG: metal-dependent transcriptional regulator [Halobacteriales archaeon SW_6_65_46]PSQ54096.1 MAG: metal-dependent transcriptional regulator [Halobacteriales archaeon SW_8_65_20]
MNTQRQYLKAVYLIQEGTDEPASTGAIADTVDVSPASANEMIGKLQDRGLADHEKYKGVSLTDEGIVRAREALETYCIIERFLVEVLEVEEESFRGEAEQLESVIDDTVADRLDTIIDRAQQCPDCFDAETDMCSLLRSDLPESEAAD